MDNFAPEAMGEYYCAGRTPGIFFFFTIPHPCLFLPPLTKQSGVPSRRIEEAGPSFAPSS